MMRKERFRGAGSRGAKGNAIIEVSLMIPWIVFLFVGVLDFGFYAYAAICTQNAARVAAISNSFSSGAAANFSSTCALVVAEMNSLPNTQSLVSGTYSCPASASAGSPIALPTVTTEAESDGSTAAVVSVTYLSVPLIPIPGILMGQMTITRTAKVPVLNSAPAG